jgi:hypothetical protein
LVVDATKLRADASPEAVLKREEYEAVRTELARILREAHVIDEREAQEGRPTTTCLGQPVEREVMRDIVRRVRKQLARTKQPPPPAAGCAPPAAAPNGPTGGETAPPGAVTNEPAGGAAAAPPAGGEGEREVATAKPKDFSHRPPPCRAITQRMRERVAAALLALEAATQDGRKHLCLTDPDARMMPEGRFKQLQECHSWEVAVDKGAGLLVVAQTSQAGNDNDRLEGVVAAAQAHLPEGVVAVDADSGFFGGDALGRLMAAGLDTCVPDSETACDLHRGRPIGTTRARGRAPVEFIYEAEQDRYRCPEGNELRLKQRRSTGDGQLYRDYRAVQECTGCPQAAACLAHPHTRYRTLKVGEHARRLAEARARFEDPEHQARYRHRGEWVETVFGVVRSSLNVGRWSLRGKEKVGHEGRLLAVGYQVRKLHAAWAAG